MSIDQKLRKKLQLWSQAGLITSEQEAHIIAHENQQATRSTLLFTIAWFAVACISLGIIAIIASNWEDIPSALKLTCYFSLFAGIGGALLHGFPDKPIIKEILRLGLMIYIMAGIGLIAQIYHLHSSPWRGLAFWCVLSLGLALQATTLWGALLWLPTALWTLASFLASLGYSSSTYRIIIILVIATLGIAASIPSPGKRSLAHFQRVGLIFALASGMIALTVHAYAAKLLNFDEVAAFVFYASAGLWALSLQRYAAIYSRGTRIGMWIFLGALSAQVSMLHVFPDLFVSKPSFKIISVTLFIAGMLGLGFAAFHQGRRRLFELICLFIFLRLLGLYAELLMSLAMTGFGLISLGIILLTGLYAWQRFKSRIFTQLEGQRDDQSV